MQLLIHAVTGNTPNAPKTSILRLSIRQKEQQLFSFHDDQDALSFRGSFSQPTDDNLFNPKQIYVAPTTGMITAPSTQELLEGPSHLSKPALFT